ncbi:DUF4192 domain-containing protein [Streptomyces sp. NPDC046985]|uniref:DUF4192 domain-containing protein n=1 Tax=Streptomyces sp. NPDC046985 TaxID=3155377 RepID=UPI0033E8433B
MTNHSETTGPFQKGEIAYEGLGPEHQVTLRTPAELADALPYLLGYRPEDSIVLVALHDRGGRGRFGGRARLGIPVSRDDWPSAARQLAHGLIAGSERRGVKPEQIVAFLCQEPAPGETGEEIMRRLRPLAQKLRTECGRLDVPVIEALCISGGRFWSYCCPNEGCCPDAGLPMGLPGTSVLAAAAAYAGVQVRGSLKELRSRLLPCETSAARSQETALDAAGRALMPRILDEASRAAVAEETLALAENLIRRFADAPAGAAAAADLRDDRLLRDEEAASLILGLQDRTTRDRAAEWMEGDEAVPALRLWRALARRCVGSYGEYAAAPLTLVGWVAWSAGDGLEAREALAMALGADPDYLFAHLLHQACNEGLDPESVRRCLRAEREQRTRSAEDGAEDSSASASADASPRRRRSRVSEPDANLPGTERTRPATSRTDGVRPAPPRASAGRTHPRNVTKGLGPGRGRDATGSRGTGKGRDATGGGVPRKGGDRGTATDPRCDVLGKPTSPRTTHEHECGDA